MELEILDEIIVESSGELEEHNSLVEEKIKKANPKYYAVETDLIRLLWRTKIFIMR